jgi:putative transposase
MERKKWSKSEKLAILKEAEVEGVEITTRKYGVYPSTFYTWRKKLRLEGAEGLERKPRTEKDEHYLRRLEDENQLLKQLLADKELEIALRDDLLKKRYPWARKEK